MTKSTNPTSASDAEAIPLASPAAPLPDFVHRVWASDAAREEWEPRISAIHDAWSQIEWRSVVAGVRRCALTIVSPDEWIDIAHRVAPHGLVAFPLQLHSFSGAYSNRGAEAVGGDPLSLRIVIGRLADAMAMKKAWAPTDDEAIGTLLGFPPCCRSFFLEHWVGPDAVDMTWETATNGFEAKEEGDGARRVEISGPPEANSLLRWLGIRAVPHMACSPQCEPSAEMGRRLMEVGRQAGFAQEVDWILEALSWPITWESVGPIATVTTPVMAFVVNTHPGEGRRVVSRR